MSNCISECLLTIHEWQTYIWNLKESEQIQGEAMSKIKSKDLNGSLKILVQWAERR